VFVVDLRIVLFPSSFQIRLVLARSSSKIFRLDCFHRWWLDRIAILDVSMLLVLARVHVRVHVSVCISITRFTSVFIVGGRDIGLKEFRAASDLRVRQSWDNDLKPEDMAIIESLMQKIAELHLNLGKEVTGFQ
jgi:hypothetical protein